MYARIYKFMENSQLFYSRQFGFRSNHSTNNALISITESIKKTQLIMGNLDVVCF